MKLQNIKAFFLLLILFSLDISKPFGYSLSTEFTLLGIILVSLNFPLATSLILSMFFGYFKDSFCADSINFSMIEFSLIAIFAYYFLHNFHKKTVKIFIILGALIFHIIISNFYINKTVYLFSLLFFIHSCLIFLILNKVTQQWLCEDFKKEHEI